MRERSEGQEASARLNDIRRVKLALRPVGQRYRLDPAERLRRSERISAINRGRKRGAVPEVPGETALAAIEGILGERLNPRRESEGSE